MNIFYLHSDPVKAAQIQYNKHVVKMILESAQMLCTAHHVYGNAEQQLNVPYKQAHLNHPSTIWTRQCRANYRWLFLHMIALGDEYTKRYNKTHLTFVMPDKTSPTNNIHDSSENNLMFSIERGCQMIAMSFQQFDPSLQYYLTELFGAYSFKLKPSNLRQTPILMDMPKKQDKSKVDPTPKQVNIGDGTDIVFPITV